MFNQTAFGATPFNRPFLTEIFFAATLSGEGDISASPSVTYTASLVMSGEGTLSSDYIRELTYAAILNGEGTLSAEMSREMISAAIMSGEGTLVARPRKYHVQSLTVDGPFGPGDKITVDSGRLRVLRNGEYTAYDGDFFDLYPGENTLTYSDSNGARTVQVRVTWRDRFL
ncbi:phage distal tail protein [Paenibacillus sp. PAMC21692]|uniref:phage distal tail protein n=1 Tax=Paenibacillus sp. PAMC21692 TaxID=2762320 RepID=UPI00164D4E0F|nr:phage tail domain-containing protein [Paenibacillus sp. PAMC21692]QNK54576.1 phage tail family protein [Paenibacillus sp. PAMC21692]